MAGVIADRFGRTFPYLRLSVTDACNYRCTYCLPNGYKKTHGEAFLSIDEIRRAVAAFADIGAWKIRLTGGEPTARTDFPDIARAVSNVPGVRRVAFTTNGYKLPERAKKYYEAGLRAINISIDSFDAKKFNEITGHDRLNDATQGVQAALAAGFEAVKINAVLMKGINDSALDEFLAFVKGRPVSLRVIELMQTGENLAFFRKYHVSADIIRKQLAERGWQLQPRLEGAGPALEYRHADYHGSIGIIAPYAKDFCTSCNRLRLSARGELHLCLFGANGHSLRHLLQDDGQKDELQAEILRLVQHKKVSHFLQDGDTGIRKNLAQVGG